MAMAAVKKLRGNRRPQPCCLVSGHHLKGGNGGCNLSCLWSQREGSSSRDGGKFTWPIGIGGTSHPTIDVHKWPATL